MHSQGGRGNPSHWLGKLTLALSFLAALSPGELATAQSFSNQQDYGSQFGEAWPNPAADSEAENWGQELEGVSAVLGNAGSAESSMADLEARVKKLEADAAKAKADADAKKKDDASKPTAKLSGRLHIDWWGFPADSPGINFIERGNTALDPQDTFQVRRARISVDGKIPDNMEYKIEMDFAVANNPVFKDLYIGWTELPLLGTVRVGNQKRPYGFDSLTSSRYLLFLERSLVTSATNPDERRLGIVSYGVSDDQQYNWRFGVFLQDDVQGDGTVRDDHYQMQFAARLANTIWWDEQSGGRGYCHLGVSSTVANPDGNAPNAGTEFNQARFETRPEGRSVNRWIDTGTIAGASWYESIGGEAVLNIGPFNCGAEYQNVWLQRETAFGRDLDFWGGYAWVAYLLTGEHYPLDRQTGTFTRLKPFENFFLVERCGGGVGGGWGAWQLVARYSHADFNDDDIAGGVGSSVTGGINWYWNAYAKMQFNYIYGRIDDRRAGGLLRDGDYQIAGCRFAIEY
jgi:phosphate-selective porin OprO/OprP